jgi:hypothetical protein
MTYPHFESTAPPDSSTPQDKIDAESRRRAFASLERCLRKLAAGTGRDHERCGKAACARSRRCRGFACEPDDEGYET